MGKPGGISVILAAIAIAQKIGNYENKPLAFIIAIAAVIALICWTIESVSSGREQLLQAKSSGEKTLKIRAQFLAYVLLACTIVIAVAWPIIAANRTITDHSTAINPRPENLKTEDAKGTRSIPAKSTIRAATRGKETINPHIVPVEPPIHIPTIGTVSQTQAPCSGGIVIGGGTASGGNCGPPSRFLDSVQRDALKAAFSPIKGIAYVQYYGTDGDTIKLAQAIYDSFHDAGWTMSSLYPEPAFPTAPFERDIAVFTPGTKPAPFSVAAEEVLEALQNPLMPKMKIEGGFSDKITEGSVKVVIGAPWAK